VEPDEVTLDQLKHIAAKGYGKDQEASKQALMVMEKFGNIEGPRRTGRGGHPLFHRPPALIEGHHHGERSEIAPS
jgi:hypothetical protein